MSYRRTLTRTAFERNYLAFHSELPVIVQAPTSVLGDGRIATGSCRFVHIDASHLYEHVAVDIRTAKAALGPDGIVVLDDFRSPHTPGVAAATWEAVFQQDLRPICVTPEKLYGTWGDPEPTQQALVELDGDAEDCHLDIDMVAGRRLIRLSGRGVAKLLPAEQQKSAPRGRPLLPRATLGPNAPPRHGGWRTTCCRPWRCERRASCGPRPQPDVTDRQGWATAVGAASRRWPSWVQLWRTERPVRAVLTRPARRRARACSDAEARPTPSVVAS